MAISKRLRYEILRRDNHACRYCGRAAPDVKLHIDHVIPVSLGGAEKDPANLVTSCAECNGGKTSSAPDQTVVADIKESAAKWKSAITQAAEEARADVTGRSELYEAVVNAWPNFHRNKIPHDFTETVDQFIAAGLPDEVIVEMSRLAGAKPSIYNRWAYFCGCCWTKIRQLQERASELLDGSEVASNRPLQTVWTAEDIDIYISRCEDFSRNAGVGQDSIDSAYCQHRDWGEGSCADPICRALRAESLSWMAFWTCRDHDKSDAVMDAADELELLH